jgi:iron complex transport system substrate-binding protein
MKSSSLDKEDRRVHRSTLSCSPFLCAFFVFCLFPLLGSPSLALNPEPVSTDRGELRIISLGPDITEKLFILGMANNIVGVTTYCERPAEARTKEKIGSVTEVNLERIVDLKPDLILATVFTQPRVIKRLQRLGLRVVIIGEPRSFDDMNRQFVDLGRLVGKEQKARQIAFAAERRVSMIKQKVALLQRPKVFVQIGAKPLFTATKESFLNDMVELSGAVNIARNAQTGFYSREEVLLRNPDVILIVTMGIVADHELEVWRRFPALSAVRSNKVLVLDPYKTCSPNPETFVEALETITAAVHQTPVIPASIDMRSSAFAQYPHQPSLWRKEKMQ